MGSFIHSFIKYLLSTCHVSFGLGFPGLKFRGNGLESTRLEGKWDHMLPGCRCPTHPSHFLSPHSHHIFSFLVTFSLQIPFDPPSTSAIKSRDVSSKENCHFPRQAALTSFIWLPALLMCPSHNLWWQLLGDASPNLRSWAGCFRNSDQVRKPNQNCQEFWTGTKEPRALQLGLKHPLWGQEPGA